MDVRARALESIRNYTCDRKCVHSCTCSCTHRLVLISATENESSTRACVHPFLCFCAYACICAHACMCECNNMLSYVRVKFISKRTSILLGVLCVCTCFVFVSGFTFQNVHVETHMCLRPRVTLLLSHLTSILLSENLCLPWQPLSSQEQSTILPACACVHSCVSHS